MREVYKNNYIEMVLIFLKAKGYVYEIVKLYHIKNGQIDFSFFYIKGDQLKDKNK